VLSATANLAAAMAFDVQRGGGGELGMSAVIAATLARQGRGLDAVNWALSTERQGDAKVAQWLAGNRLNLVAEAVACLALNGEAEAG